MAHGDPIIDTAQPAAPADGTAGDAGGDRSRDTTATAVTSQHFGLEPFAIRPVIRKLVRPVGTRGPRPATAGTPKAPGGRGAGSARP